MLAATQLVLVAGEVGAIARTRSLSLIPSRRTQVDGQQRLCFFPNNTFSPDCHADATQVRVAKVEVIVPALLQGNGVIFVCRTFSVFRVVFFFVVLFHFHVSSLISSAMLSAQQVFRDHEHGGNDCVYRSSVNGSLSLYFGAGLEPTCCHAVRLVTFVAEIVLSNQEFESLYEPPRSSEFRSSDGIFRSMTGMGTSTSYASMVGVVSCAERHRHSSHS